MGPVLPDSPKHPSLVLRHLWALVWFAICTRDSPLTPATVLLPAAPLLIHTGKHAQGPFPIQPASVCVFPGLTFFLVPPLGQAEAVRKQHYFSVQSSS